MRTYYEGVSVYFVLLLQTDVEIRITGNNHNLPTYTEVGRLQDSISRTI
jgi:hypothetical protein